MTGKKQAGKLMKSVPTAITAVLGIVLLWFLAGCVDALNPPPPGREAGTGRALVRIGPRAEGARTIMPAGYEGLSYTLTFTSGDLTVTEVLTGAETAIDLEAGAWNLSVTGDKDGTPVLEGSVEGIEIQSGETTPVSVTLKGKTGGGSGTLSYALTFPDTVIQGSLKVYGWEDGELKATVNLLEGPTPGGGKKTRSGILALTAGYYRLDIDLESGTGVLNWSDIAHIYPGLTTTLEIEFDAGDFAVVDVVSAASLAAVLGSIPELPDGAVLVYSLTSETESMTPKYISHTGAVTVTIDGGGRTVTLSEAGSLIAIGSGVTLKLKNITLRGRGLNVDNNTALITVQPGGTLELKDGGIITGNKNTASIPFAYAAAYARGGGVYNEGDFTMSGGSITGNTASAAASYALAPSNAYGGGVYNDGDFTMSGGTITGNTASSSRSAYGGGVHNANAGDFTMSGGTITNNTASVDSSSSSHAYGGGVHNDSGTFIMNGGEIVGNTASASTYAHGGGVFNNAGNFTLSGGKIAGNTASASTYACGGGVSNYGDFTMSGGEIAGNRVFAPSYAYGGGVYNDPLWSTNITFTKKGGTIYGDTDTIAGNGTETDNTAGSGNGHAVYLEENTKCRNSTAGPAVDLYAGYTSGTWTFTDPTTGGVGDTTGNWEE
jgi:hypothetical protein